MGLLRSLLLAEVLAEVEEAAAEPVLPLVVEVEVAVEPAFPVLEAVAVVGAVVVFLLQVLPRVYLNLNRRGRYFA